MGSRVRVSSGPPNKEALRLRAFFVWNNLLDVDGLIQMMKISTFNSQFSTSNCLGLTGFDSKDNGFVSMQAHASAALKTDALNLIGENNYALAA